MGPHPKEKGRFGFLDVLLLVRDLPVSLAEEHIQFSSVVYKVQCCTTCTGYRIQATSTIK